MCGRAGLELQRRIKECYDPNNILYTDQFINISKYKKMGLIKKF